MTNLSLARVLSARQVVRRHTWRTPLLVSPGMRRLARAEVQLKLECWQLTGSFKIRGALAKLATLSPDDRASGIVTASAGNHGLGLAYASLALGVPPPTIFVPTNTPATKLDRLATYDCEVRRAGQDYDASHALAEQYAAEQGSLYLSAYDDPTVIAGQGTVGLEIFEDWPEADTLLVPVGGGGLMAGISVVAKAVASGTRLIGVQPEASPAAYLSLRDGRAHETYPAGPTICDGLAGGFGRVPYEIAASLIDEILVVPEADVHRAVAWLLSQEQLVVEGSGAIAVAPLLNGQLDLTGRKVVAVLTGRNIDSPRLQQILAAQLAKP
jgi:threonine dehydratase